MADRPGPNLPSASPGRSISFACLIRRSRVPSRERVAGLEVPRLEPAPEPLLALGRRAVRERLRHHVAARGPLQLIVADGAGRVEGLVHVAGLEDVPRALGMIAPDARVTVGLQLETYGERVRARFVRALLRGLDL